MSLTLYMFLVSELAILGLMTALWLVSLLIKNASIVDNLLAASYDLLADAHFRRDSARKDDENKTRL